MPFCTVEMVSPTASPPTMARTTKARMRTIEGQNTGGWIDWYQRRGPSPTGCSGRVVGEVSGGVATGASFRRQGSCGDSTEGPWRGHEEASARGGLQPAGLLDHACLRCGDPAAGALRPGERGREAPGDLRAGRA